MTKRITKSKIQFDPDFIEETVFLFIKSLGDRNKTVQDFHRQRESIYELNLIFEERDKRFKNLYSSLFRCLELQNIFENITGEFPVFNDEKILVFIKKVNAKKQEETELFTQGNMKTLCIGLQSIRILDKNFLESFLRFELMHISDMLDPDFRYSPNIELGGNNRMEDNLIRERFRFLWDLYINFRMVRNGHSTDASKEHIERAFQSTFHYWSKDMKEKILASMQNGKNFTQTDLIKMSRDNRSDNILGAGGLRCPLCNYTCYEPVSNWTEEKLLVADAVKEDFPLWSLESGICPQCFEMYQSKIKVKL